MNGQDVSGPVFNDLKFRDWRFSLDSLRRRLHVKLKHAYNCPKRSKTASAILDSLGEFWAIAQAYISAFSVSQSVVAVLAHYYAYHGRLQPGDVVGHGTKETKVGC